MQEWVSIAEELSKDDLWVTFQNIRAQNNKSEEWFHLMIAYRNELTIWTVNKKDPHGLFKLKIKPDLAKKGFFID